MAMLMDLLMGSSDEDDDKWKRYTGLVFAYQFAGLPLLRELAAVAAYAFSGEGFKPDATRSPAFAGVDLIQNTLLRTANAMEDDDKVSSAVKAVADLLSYGSGIPASRVYYRLAEGYRQVTEESESVPTNLLFPNPELRRRNR